MGLSKKTFSTYLSTYSQNDIGIGPALLGGEMRVRLRRERDERYPQVSNLRLPPWPSPVLCRPKHCGTLGLWDKSHTERTSQADRPVLNAFQSSLSGCKRSVMTWNDSLKKLSVIIKAFVFRVPVPPRLLRTFSHF